MLVTIVSAYNSCRVQMLKEYYTSKGYEVKTILDSNEKEIIESWNELQHQIDFAKKAKEKMMAMSPDLIHCLIPYYSFIKEFSKYKRTHDVKLILDFIKIPQNHTVFEKISNRFKEKYIRNASVILCQSEWDKKQIRNARVLYPCTGKMCKTISPDKTKDEISFCVIGSNDLDVSLILSLLKECSVVKNCVLHIIGDWKKKENFIQSVLSVGVSVIDHKELHSVYSLQEVFDQCHYSLNIFDSHIINKEALDYMCAGIPIINSTLGDLQNFCELWNVGINVSFNNVKEIASMICNEDMDSLLQKRKNIQNLYNTYFSRKQLYKTLDDIQEELYE